MIERVLPPDVAAWETFGELDEPLFPVEAAAIAMAVEKRRREFITGRGCARRALAGLGLDRCAVPRGVRGAPVWPSGVVGSLTHCEGFRAAAVCRNDGHRALGIDAEVHAPLPDGVLEVVSLPEEREHLDLLAALDPGICWDRVLFSAKESVFKAWFSLSECWLGFEEASVTIDHLSGTFSARLLVPGPPVGGASLAGFSGGWDRQEGLLVTAVTVPR